MSAIFKREFKSAFCNMTAVIFIAYVLVWFGIYTVASNLAQGSPVFEATISSVGFISLLAIPLITMRSFAEEKHSKTDQLLYSLPIKTTSIVLAKFFSMAVIFAIPVVIIATYPLILTTFGTVYIPTALSTLFAYYLLGCSVITIGMFISSLTESQVIAAVLNLGAIVLIYYISALSSLFSTEAAASFAAFLIIAVILGIVTKAMTKNNIAALIVSGVLAVATLVVYIIKKTLFEGLFPTIMSSLDLFSKTDTFRLGVFDVSAVIFYLSVIAFFIFLTVQSMEKKRWN